MTPDEAYADALDENAKLTEENIILVRKNEVLRWRLQDIQDMHNEKVAKKIKRAIKGQDWLKVVRLSDTLSLEGLSDNS